MEGSTSFTKDNEPTLTIKVEMPVVHTDINRFASAFGLSAAGARMIGEDGFSNRSKREFLAKLQDMTDQ